MELSKKTTILLSPEMHRRLAELARRNRTSIGGLVRDAVAEQYGLVDQDDRVDAVDELASLSLPVGPVEQMIADSVPASDENVP